MISSTPGVSMPKVTPFLADPARFQRVMRAMRRMIDKN
jgi:hypothetical protein